MIATLPTTSFQIVVGILTVITIPAVAPTRQPASWVFGAFNSDLASTHLPSSVRDQGGRRRGGGGR